MKICSVALLIVLSGLLVTDPAAQQFRMMTAEAGVESRLTGMPRGQMGNKFGAAWGDYDNDGDPDLFLTQIGPDILYQNQGDGTFADVSAQANVAGSGTNHDTSALWIMTTTVTWTSTSAPG